MQGQEKAATTEGGTMTGARGGRPAGSCRARTRRLPSGGLPGALSGAQKTRGTGARAHRQRKHRRSAAALHSRQARRRESGAGPPIYGTVDGHCDSSWSAGVSKRIKASTNHPEGPQMTDKSLRCAGFWLLLLVCAQSGHEPALAPFRPRPLPSPARGSTPRTTPLGLFT